MLGVTYGHGILRDYVVTFGTLFNNISIIRNPVGGVNPELKTYVRVPLSYAPKERFIARLNQDPNLTRAVSLTLPRMSFEMTTMNYAGERKLNTINKIRKFTDSSNGTHVASAFGPVPYDIGFSLHIYTRNTEDASNIVEQILPFFTPEFTVSIKSMTDLAIKVDAPVVLNGISKEDGYEGGFEERRTIIWTLDFTLKGVLFGPVSTTSGLIKKAYIEFYTPSQYSVETANARSTNSSVTNQIRLASTSSLIGGHYKGATINITSGTASGSFGDPQKRITGYFGPNQVANVYPAFSAAPDTTSIYKLEFNIPDEDYDAGDISAGPRNAAKLASRVYLQPGLTEEGLPTTNTQYANGYSDPLSVDVTYIDANDDYGIIETTTFFDSGIRRNLITGLDEY